MCGREITCMYLQRNDISIEIARPNRTRGVKKRKTPAKGSFYSFQTADGTSSV